MGYHAFRDSLFCSLHGMKLGMAGKKFFSRSVESPVLSELYESATAAVPQVSSTGSFPVQAKVAGHAVNPVLHVLQWKGEGLPVILYHHLSNEQPLDASCRRIFLNPKYPFNANIVLVQAAYHETPSSFSECSSDLQRFAEMVAVSARVIDECVAQFSSRKMMTIVCGLKLGGWVANLHHALSNTASMYIPLFAGAGFGDIFIDSKFSKCVSSLAKKNHQRVRRVLNFDDLFMARQTHSNVYPLLAVHDQIAMFVRQRPAFGDMKFTLIEKGHITGANAFSKIRKHCMNVLEKIKR
jgi:hypothetical protein